MRIITRKGTVDYYGKVYDIIFLKCWYRHTWVYYIKGMDRVQVDGEFGYFFASDGVMQKRVEVAAARFNINEGDYFPASTINLTVAIDSLMRECRGKYGTLSVNIDGSTYLECHEGGRILPSVTKETLRALVNTMAYTSIDHAVARVFNKLIVGNGVSTDMESFEDYNHELWAALTVPANNEHVEKIVTTTDNNKRCTVTLAGVCKVHYNRLTDEMTAVDLYTDLRYTDKRRRDIDFKAGDLGLVLMNLAEYLLVTHIDEDLLEDFPDAHVVVDTVERKQEPTEDVIIDLSSATTEDDRFIAFANEHNVKVINYSHLMMAKSSSFVAGAKYLTEDWLRKVDWDAIIADEESVDYVLDTFNADLLPTVYIGSISDKGTLVLDKVKE